MNERSHSWVGTTPLFKTVTFTASCFTSIALSSVAQAATIDRYFTVQPIRVCDNAGANCASTPIFQPEVAKIYQQAGVASVFLPTTQLNNTSILNTTGISAIQQAGNPGASANTTTINTWFVNNLTVPPPSVLFGEAWVGANGVVVNSSAVQGFNSGNGRRDTLAHELGHNFGLRHDNFGAGANNNLVTAGSTRLVPDGVGNIVPDGSDLSQLTAAQIAQIRTSPLVNQVPEVIVDTNGSTPFDTNNFFLVDFKNGPNNVFLQSLTVDLTPVNAFFDSTNTPPGTSSSPFGLSSLVGLNTSDITLAGGNTALNGSQQLTLNFAPNSFAKGDSLRFGVDIDLFNNIDFFGATPTELIGSLFSFKFSDGYGSQSAIGSDLIASSIDPTNVLPFSGQPSGGIAIPLGTIVDNSDPDPVDVPEPSSSLAMIALGVGTLSRKIWKRRKKLTEG